MSDTSFLNATEPYSLFDAWLNEAIKSEINDPNAMALASVDQAGMPNVCLLYTSPSPRDA